MAKASRHTRRAAVIRHVPHEGLGLIEKSLTSAEIGYKYFHPTRLPGSLDDFNYLIIMGGPWSLYENYPWLEPETKLIRRAVETDLPVLGICLGAQLIAAALGANVMPCDSKEIGWYPLKLTAAGLEDPLLSCLSHNETVFQWHGDTFEVPEGAKLLASSPFCDHQAFRYGKATYALQFHLEVTPFIIEEWLQVPENQAEISALGLTPAEISKGSEIHSQRLQALAQCFFAAFLKLG